MKMETPPSSGLTSPNGLINIPTGYNLLEDPEEDVRPHASQSLTSDCQGDPIQD
jgi:hypothetical protein